MTGLPQEKKTKQNKIIIKKEGTFDNAAAVIRRKRCSVSQLYLYPALLLLVVVVGADPQSIKVLFFLFTTTMWW